METMTIDQYYALQHIDQRLTVPICGQEWLGTVVRLHERPGWLVVRLDEGDEVCVRDREETSATN